MRTIKTYCKGAPFYIASSSKKVAPKSFILQGRRGPTFFRPCLGGAQSVAYRNVAFCARDEPANFRASLAPFMDGVETTAKFLGAV